MKFVGHGSGESVFWANLDSILKLLWRKFRSRWGAVVPLSCILSCVLAENPFVTQDRGQHRCGTGAILLKLPRSRSNLSIRRTRLQTPPTIALWSLN